MRKLFPSLIALSFVLAACSGGTASVSENAGDSMSALSEDAMEDTMAEGDGLAVNSEESFITFTGKSNIINHEGSFGSFTVSFVPDTDEPENVENASLEVSIDLDSVESDPGVTAHMKRADFFDVENYPVATFSSTEIAQVEGDTYEITGNLSMKGITKEVTLDAEITSEKLVIQFDLPRRDFTVGNDSYGDKLLEPLVPVDAEIVFVQE